MPELLVKFDEPIAGPDGRKYFAQTAGRETDGGLWEGWLEFLPVDESGEAVCSDRETTQPNRKNLDYWSQGLTVVYLQGALARALAKNAPPCVTTTARREAPRFAPRRVSRPPSSTSSKARPILDPYAVYAQGEHILRSELGALSRDQVETIATAYGFTPARRQSDGTVNSDGSDLVDTVVNGVRSAESR